MLQLQVPTQASPALHDDLDSSHAPSGSLRSSSALRGVEEKIDFAVNYDYPHVFAGGCSSDRAEERSEERTAGNPARLAVDVRSVEVAVTSTTPSTAERARATGISSPILPLLQIAPGGLAAKEVIVLCGGALSPLFRRLGSRSLDPLYAQCNRVAREAGEAC